MIIDNIGNHIPTAFKSQMSFGYMLSALSVYISVWSQWSVPDSAGQKPVSPVSPETIHFFLEDRGYEVAGREKGAYGRGNKVDCYVLRALIWVW